jgi:SAM-dependent methyltransferase
MIPKRFSKSTKKRAKTIATKSKKQTLNKMRKATGNQKLSWRDALNELRIKANLNAFKRTGEDPNSKRYATRTLQGAKVKDGRQRDTTANWGTSFNPNLNLLNRYFGMDLVTFIKQIKKGKVKVASIGCGPGKAESQLKDALGNRIELHATGVHILESWTQHKNYKSINWHVAHGNALTRVFKPKSLDFVFSRLGIHHAGEAFTQRNHLALAELEKVLKKGGKALIDMEGEFFEEDLPENLKIIFNEHRRVEHPYGKKGPYSHRVILLEKV